MVAMPPFLRALALCSMLVCAATAKVLTLSEADFQKVVDKEGDLIVMFFAPDDDSAKTFRPIFETSANELEDFSPKVTFAKVDVKKEKKLAAKFGVKYYPTLRYFKEGEKRAVSADDAIGTQEQLVNWIKRVSRAPPRVMELKTSKQMKAFKRNITRTHDVAVIGFFSDEESASLFLDVATDFNYPVKFAWTTRASARKIFKLGKSKSAAAEEETEAEEEEEEEADELEEGSDDETSETSTDGEEEAQSKVVDEDMDMDEIVETCELLMLKPYDEKRMTYTYSLTRREKGDSRHGVADLMNMMIGVPQEEALRMMPKSEKFENMTKWIEAMMIPLVVPFAQGYDSLIFQGPIKVHEILMVDSESAEESELIELETMFREVAKDNRGEILHIIMGNNKYTEDIRQYFGIDDDDLPTILISDLRDATEDAPQGTHYTWDSEQPINVENMRAFEAGFWSGDLEDHTRQKKSKSKKKSKKDSAATKSEDDAKEEL